MYLTIDKTNIFRHLKGTEKTEKSIIDCILALQMYITLGTINIHTYYVLYTYVTIGKTNIFRHNKGGSCLQGPLPRLT
jgi:hypothetical protein